MDWKIGDTAICVKVGILPNTPANATGPYPPLRLNLEYLVQNVYLCPKCKMQSLDVGLGSSPASGNTICKCEEKIPCKEIHWCASERFVKKNMKNKEEQIADAISNEDYELAAQIKNEK